MDNSINPTKNISSEDESLFQKGRREGIREAIELLINIKERKANPIFAGIWRSVDKDGWELLTVSERQILYGIAKKLADNIGDSPPIFDIKSHQEAISFLDKQSLKSDVYKGKII